MVNLKEIEEKIKLYELQVESKVVGKTSMTEKINKMQTVIDESNAKNKLALQVKLNQLRHDLDIHNPDEVIGYADDGKYVQ